MTEQPTGEPEWVGQAVEPTYTNVMKVNGGPFDAMLVFGLMEPRPGAPLGTQSEIGEVARISMSWGHLKSMIPLLARMVADYETKAGEIPAPGFGELWKG